MAVTDSGSNVVNVFEGHRFPCENHKLHNAISKLLKPETLAKFPEISSTFELCKEIVKNFKKVG